LFSSACRGFQLLHDEIPNILVLFRGMIGVFHVTNNIRFLGQFLKGLLLQLGHVIAANILLAAFYGLCLGVFGIANRNEPEFRFMAADAIKVPLLFLLTLAITFPSLYVFNALVGSRLGVVQIGRLMAAALAVLLAVLASFAPIVAFFSITSTSYPFILLLNVTLFVLAGGFGIHFLWGTLLKLTARAVSPRIVSPPTSDHSESVEPSSTGGLGEAERIPPAVLDQKVITVFGFWITAFALVGMQMSWGPAAFHRIAGKRFCLVPSAARLVRRGCRQGDAWAVLRFVNQQIGKLLSTRFIANTPNRCSNQIRIQARR
jgi:hypothetical protein